jgi:hypothetical protein
MPAPSPIGQAPPPATPTIRDLPTKMPTATAGVFELLPTNTIEPTSTPISSTLLNELFGPGSYENDLNPLTGLRIEDPSRLERRPMVIKITNFPRSVRPQWGLTAADHVYEYYLEDELTRFAGIFYGNDAERVGPIRSARPFDEQLIRAYKGIFVFAFADDRLIEFWEDSDINPYLVFEGEDNCPPICRIGSENNYNTLFADTSLLREYTAGRGIQQGRQDLTGLRFMADSEFTASGGQALRLEIRFSPESYHYWEYRPGLRRYLRWQDVERRSREAEIFEPLVDSLNDQQVYADNLIILRVPMSYFYKSNSTEVYDFKLLGTGTAYAMREGRIFEIQWKRPSKESMLTLSFMNGAPYPLKPGNIWFEVLSDITPHQVFDFTWRFDFELPESLPVPTSTPKKRSP